MDYNLDIELDILVGCDGTGKSTAYDNLKKEYKIMENILFFRFPSDDIRHLISMIPEFYDKEYPLLRHKMFEVDFHSFLQNITYVNFLEHKEIDIDEPIRVVMDRFFPCNMAYGLYHLGDHPWVLPTLDFIGNFINKNTIPKTNLQLNILHISPNVEKWSELNSDEMSTDFLLNIEYCYQNVYNYLQQNYTKSVLEDKGISSLKITKLFNNYDGNIEKEIQYCAKFPKI